MKKYYYLTLSSALLLPSISHADEANASLKFSGNVGFFSEYVFRGISQSDESPALQGGFDVEHESGLHAGIWGSSVDFNDGDEAHLETDIYGGYAANINQFHYDIGGIYYAYPGADSNLNYDFFEIYGAVGYDFKKFSLSGSVNFSPDYFAESGNAVYTAATIEAPIYEALSASAQIGYQSIEDNAAFGVPDYTDWSLGLNYNYNDFDFSLKYTDTNLNEPTECADGCDARIIFGISKSF